MNEDKLHGIILRIRKLLALANRNSSVEEAASAMAEAQRLMSKHQIASVEEEAQSSVVVEAIEEEHGRMVRWRSVLALSIAEANFCRSVWVQNGRRGYGAITFFGTQANVTMAKALFELVVAQIDRLTKEAVLSATRKAAIDARQFGESFRLGAVLIVRKRLAALTEERDVELAACSSSTALALIGRNDEAIERAMANLGKLQSTGESKAQVAPNAFKAGLDAGENIHIGKQLAGKASH